MYVAYTFKDTRALGSQGTVMLHVCVAAKNRVE